MTSSEPLPAAPSSARSAEVLGAVEHLFRHEAGKMVAILTRIFGSRNERLLKQYGQAVREMNALEPTISALSDEGLRNKTTELKTRVADGESLATVRAESFPIEDMAAHGFAFEQLDQLAMDHLLGLR